MKYNNICLLGFFIFVDIISTSLRYKYDLSIILENSMYTYLTLTVLFIGISVIETALSNLLPRWMYWQVSIEQCNLMLYNGVATTESCEYIVYINCHCTSSYISVFSCGYIFPNIKFK